MKKNIVIIAIIIAVIAVATAAVIYFNRPAPAPEVPEIPTGNVELISGEVTEITDEWILITDENGQQVQVNLTDKTEFEGEKPVIGCRIQVTYNGIMTRSLPPQIAAIKVTCNALTGIVEELAEDGFLLRRTDVDDVVFVHATPEQLDTVAVDANVTVYFNGVMTLSLPGQINAELIVVNQ